uniref:Uncharacterized protein n=1 Tax=Onchocerca volvulus TaxID=6282 RepID=A0A8R1TQ93_ONCVO
MRIENAEVGQKDKKLVSRLVKGRESKVESQKSRHDLTDQGKCKIDEMFCRKRFQLIPEASTSSKMNGSDG